MWKLWPRKRLEKHHIVNAATINWFSVLNFLLQYTYMNAGVVLSNSKQCSWVYSLSLLFCLWQLHNSHIQLRNGLRKWSVTKHFSCVIVYFISNNCGIICIVWWLCSITYLSNFKWAITTIWILKSLKILYFSCRLMNI